MKGGKKVILSLCQHTVLTPAQREFVHAVAASHSATHARRLITQHYLNVLHSCVQTGESGGGGAVPLNMQTVFKHFVWVSSGL